MFDVATSSVLFLATSSGMFYPQLVFLPAFLQAVAHAIAFAIWQSPSYGNKWGELSSAAAQWEYGLLLLPLAAIGLLWVGRMLPNGAPTVPSKILS